MFKTILASTALASALLISPSLQAATPADALVQASRFDDIISLDPAEMYEISAFEIVTNAYDKLVAYDIEDTSRIVPQLAEAWEISEDGTTFTFKLREDVTFHSGNPFTAEDVVYSLARFAALDKGPAFLIHDLGVTPDNYEDVLRAVDEHTFEMTLDQGYAPSFVLNVLSGGTFSIVDSALVRENEVEGDWGSAWLKNHSAGSGPFRLDQMVPNDRIVMSRFDDYWQGTPELGRLMWRHVEEPASQRLLLEQGDIDVARNLLVDQLEPLRQSGEMQLIEAKLGTQLYMGLNVSREPLEDVRVRQALKYLVDYEAMTDTFMRDAWIVNQTFLPEGMLGHIDRAPFSFDPERARQLLAEAGHEDGFSLSINVATGPERLDTAQAIQATFAQANVELEILPSDARTALTTYRAREHDIYLGTWGIDYFDPATNAVFVANEDNSPEAAANPLTWRNAWQDEELTARAQELALERDEEARNEGYQQLIKDWQKVSPFIMLFQQVAIAAVRPEVKNFSLAPTNDGNRYHRVSKE